VFIKEAIKFGPLHGKTINEYVAKTVDFMSNAMETYSIQNHYQQQQYNNYRKQYL